VIDITYLIFTIIVALIVIGCAIPAGVMFRRGDWDIAILPVGILVVVLGLYTWAVWPPWDMHYHFYEPVTGTVAKVDKRMVSAGESSMEEKILVTLDGEKDQYGCTDTRCTSLEEGDHVALMCLPVWQTYGTDGFDCEFTSATKD
jgi:hypothetical protein